MTNTERARRVFDVLMSRYRSREPLLNFSSPFQLLIAVILSAQTTDMQVNRVTPELFRRYPDPERLAEADVEKVEDILRSIGFFRTKARKIIQTAELLSTGFGGTVPGRMDDLLKFPGVGRKSANVVLGHCFGTPAIIVYTHFMRVCRRIGLTGHRDPGRIENDLRMLIPREKATDFSMIVNLHGRAVCRARKPLCAECPVRDFCVYPEKNL